MYVLTKQTTTKYCQQEETAQLNYGTLKVQILRHLLSLKATLARFSDASGIISTSECCSLLHSTNQLDFGMLLNYRVDQSSALVTTIQFMQQSGIRLMNPYLGLVLVIKHVECGICGVEKMSNAYMATQAKFWPWILTNMKIL